MRLAILMAGVAIMAIASPILAAETISYSYDAKGRLVKVMRTVGTTDTVIARYFYDKANNRRTVSTDGSGEPPPPPPPINLSPVPRTVSAQNVRICGVLQSVDVTTGATDPENNVPITLTAASGSSGRGLVSVVANAVQHEAFATIGTDLVKYTLSDSLGATVNATFNVNITAGPCD